MKFATWPSKEYAHISNEILEQVKDIDYTVEMPSNEVVPVTLMFVDTSKASLDRILGRAGGLHLCGTGEYHHHG